MLAGSLAGCGDPPLSPDLAPHAPPLAASIATATAAPSGLAATAVSPSAIALAWRDNSSNEAGFEVWRSTNGEAGSYALRASVAANVRKWKDTGLTTATRYCYRVRATVGGGVPASDFSSTACATTWLKPPTNLVAVATAATTITLTWADKSASESGFEVWRSTTGSDGSYGTLTTVPANSSGADDSGLATGNEYCYRVRAVGAAPTPPSALSDAACSTPAPVALVVHLVLFGDSNTDRCEEIAPPNRISSYVSTWPRLGPDDPPLTCSVPGKVAAAWQAARAEPLRVVNHAIASSTSGGGGFGGPNRTSQGAPNARLKVGGFTRFEGEVLGKGYPWSGGEPTNASFPTGPVKRVNAFAPGPNDFVYISLGTNDDAGPTRTLSAAQTAANLRWMVQQWTGAGRAADHVLLTTLAPRDRRQRGHLDPRPQRPDPHAGGGARRAPDRPGGADLGRRRGHLAEPGAPPRRRDPLHRGGAHAGGRAGRGVDVGGGAGRALRQARGDRVISARCWPTPRALGRSRTRWPSR